MKIVIQEQLYLSKIMLRKTGRCYSGLKTRKGKDKNFFTKERRCLLALIQEKDVTVGAV